jgi:hypothetical protein
LNVNPRTQSLNNKNKRLRHIQISPSVLHNSSKAPIKDFRGGFDMPNHKVVSRDEWLAVRKQRLGKEKNSPGYAIK